MSSERHLGYVRCVSASHFWICEVQPAIFFAFQQGTTLYRLKRTYISLYWPIFLISERKVQSKECFCAGQG